MDHLNINTSSLIDFKKNNSRKVALANKLVNLSGLVCDIFLQTKFESFHQQLLIQDIFRNFRESLLFCMRSEPQSALSMGRIAAEGSRNLLRILDDPTLTALYSEGRKEKENRKRWRKEFKFKDEESALLSLYNIGSDFGIHAAMPITDSISNVETLMGKTFTLFDQKEHSKSVFILIMLTMHLTMENFITSARKEIEKDQKTIALKAEFSKEWSKLLPYLRKQKNILSKKPKL
tara:strand:+ start:7085 stop:7786 length:702 start_codon:yes stop_codon:yes gene_type:complete